ncbi:MAG TPA: tetraacyldisaccharide 4'-kinase [Nitrospirota bacterium]|nr:tetraacyldisaccharide 4'-kinase [Nitrospirota bacterium]
MLDKSYVEDLIYGRRQSHLLSAVLSALSLIYGFIVRIRALLYWLHLLNVKKLPCAVVSIGNITLGGTGKTPTVISVARFLAGNHKQPLVVSRGYGREKESKVLAVSDGLSILVNARRGGDEPVLIASRLPGVPVMVGSDRYQAALHGLRKYQGKIVILDDGFQHRSLRRNADIVLVDATDPFGNGKLFPAGILREPITALKRAQAIMITRIDQAGNLEELKTKIKRITSAPIFTSYHQPIDLVECTTGDVKSLGVLRGARTFVFSGIARPSSFTALLSSLGVNVAVESTYPDHYEYQKSDLASIYEKATDARVNMIITTEKDMVRIRDLKPDGVWALRIDLAVCERPEWEQFLARLA